MTKELTYIYETSNLSSFGITPYILVRKTPKSFVVAASGGRALTVRDSEYVTYHETFAEARTHLMAQNSQQIEDLKHRMEKLRNDTGRVFKLEQENICHPTADEFKRQGKITI